MRRPLLDLEHAQDDVGEGLSRYEALAAVFRLLAGFAVFLGALSLLSLRFRGPLESLGHWFVDRFGALGMAAGSFLADGMHFPVPPQFYLFAGIAGGFGRPAALASVFLGSVLGGLAAFTVARRVSGIRLLATRFRSPRRVLVSLIVRHGYWGLVLAAALPVSFWLLCTLAGVLRLPYRAYGVLALMRAPRIALSYLIIVAAWTAAVPR